MVCAPVRSIIPELRGLSTVQALYLTCTCTTIPSVDLAHYGVSRAKDWLSVNCGTNITKNCVLEYSELFSFLSVRGTE